LAEVLLTKTPFAIFSGVLSKLNSGSSGFLSQVIAVETIETNERIGLKKGINFPIANPKALPAALLPTIPLNAFETKLPKPIILYPILYLEQLKH